MSPKEPPEHKNHTKIKNNAVRLPISIRDLRWLNRAVKSAYNNHDSGSYRLAAITVKGGSILAAGTNRHRNNPLWNPEIPREHWSIHAEEACLRQTNKPSGCTLYIARITPGGQTALARPCQKCLELAKEHNVGKIVYTTENGVETLRLRDLIS
jgi:tRNA(Arg) A34 adenosine deaminase TadA